MATRPWCTEGSSRSTPSPVSATPTRKSKPRIRGATSLKSLPTPCVGSVDYFDNATSCRCASPPQAFGRGRSSIETNTDAKKRLSLGRYSVVSLAERARAKPSLRSRVGSRPRQGEAGRARGPHLRPACAAIAFVRTSCGAQAVMSRQRNVRSSENPFLEGLGDTRLGDGLSETVALTGGRGVLSP